MNSLHRLHDVELRPAFFEGGEQATLLRYLDADFIARFTQDIQQKRFSAAQFGAWLEEERHGQYDQTPVLRLPTHRAFHIVCCEAVCRRFGTPALDPQKIASAGFVIRRETPRGQQAWILEEGEAIGWQNRGAPSGDPDLSRRLCRNGISHRRTDQAAFSGEQVFPLHPLTVKDNEGRCRTLLFGYVPLGGFYYERDMQLSESDGNDIDQLAVASLNWPFGYASGSDRRWSAIDSVLVDHGRPTVAFAELLMQLVNRYHLGEQGHDDNHALENLCATLPFFNPEIWRHIPLVFNPAFPTRVGMVDPFMLPASWTRGYPLALSSGVTLLDYLRTCFAQGDTNPLVAWIAQVSDLADAAGGLSRIGRLPALPAADGRGVIRDSLVISESSAETFRLALGQRLRTLTLATTREIPLPKFAQGRDDQFRIIPFIRSRTEKGAEQFTWAGRRAQSSLFRVAASFDPQASRPSLIPMPSLRDLKRGLAKGASILTPGDTFSLVNSLKLKKGVSGDTVKVDKPVAPTVQWICSFSLPVITLVAMILLMIMVSLLNIIFFWMPWVRICLPFPKIPKGSDG